MVQMIQTTFIHLVVIMLGSDMVQIIQTTFIHQVVIMLGSDMVQMIQTTFIIHTPGCDHVRFRHGSNAGMLLVGELGPHNWKKE